MSERTLSYPLGVKNKTHATLILMIRILLVCLTLLVLNVARAEEFSISGNFGIRADGIPNALSDGKFFAVYPNMGFHLAVEAGTTEWRGGLRFSASTNIALLLCVQANVTAFLRYVFLDDTSVYGGIGTRTTFHFFSPPWTDWHALLGFRLNNGIFFEIMPGIATGNLFRDGTLAYSDRVASVFIVSISIGRSWNF